MILKILRTSVRPPTDFTIMATEGSWLFEMFFLKMSGSVAFCFEDLAAIATLKKGERTISHTNQANFIL